MSNDRTDDQQTMYIDVLTLAATNRRLRRWIAVDEGVDAHCFARDVVNCVIPYRFGRDSLVTLEPSDDETEQLVTDALTREPYDRLENAVVKFIRATAQTLVDFGTADYELVFERAADSTVPESFVLRPVTPHSIRRRFFTWMQDIGPTMAERHRIARYRPIDRSRIIRFTLPPPWNEARFFRLKQQLAFCGGFSEPMFTFAFRERLKTYDFGTAVTLKDRAVAAVTREIGWHGTAGFDKHALDSYAFARELRFKRFLIDLRTSILAQLNAALERPLARLGKRGELVLSGVITHLDIDRADTTFHAGADLVALLRELRSTS